MLAVEFSLKLSVAVLGDVLNQDMLHIFRGVIRGLRRSFGHSHIRILYYLSYISQVELVFC